MGLVILLLMLAGIVVYFISIYNDLVGARNGCENAFAEVDVQLRRRRDLVSQLLESLQGDPAGNETTPERVGIACNVAMSAPAAAPFQPDPSAMQQLCAAES